MLYLTLMQKTVAVLARTASVHAGGPGGIDTGSIHQVHARTEPSASLEGTQQNGQQNDDLIAQIERATSEFLGSLNSTQVEQKKKIETLIEEKKNQDMTKDMTKNTTASPPPVGDPITPPAPKR